MNPVSEAPLEREPIRTQESGWPALALFLTVSLGLLTLFPLARRAGPMARVLMPGWLENLGSFGSLLLLAVGGVIFGVGRLRPADLGLGGRKLVQATVTIGAIWILNQVIAAATALATTGTVRLDRAWTTTSVPRALLWAAVMFLATALYEEIAFRGFLFPSST